MRTVRVEWEGPLSLDAVKALDDDYEDCGLYQIYGRHIIFSYTFDRQNRTGTLIYTINVV